MRELGWISQEEDWCIVGNQIPIALIRLELDGESSRIASTIVRTRFATNCGESDSDGALFTLLEHVCKTQIIQAMCSFVRAVSSTPFGVHNTLWDSLAVEM